MKTCKVDQVDTGRGLLQMRWQADPEEDKNSIRAQQKFLIRTIGQPAGVKKDPEGPWAHTD